MNYHNADRRINREYRRLQRATWHTCTKARRRRGKRVDLASTHEETNIRRYQRTMKHAITDYSAIAAEGL